MKLLKVAVVMALVVLMAAPAFAEMKLNGYYRLQGTVYDDGTGANDENRDFSQRLRMKLTNTLNENVSFVYYGEFDTDWGQAGKLGAGNPGGGGGTVAGDGVNLESKNVYLTVKGDNFSTVLGLQGMGDTFDGLIFSEDMAGATFKTSAGPAEISLVYSMLSEGTKQNNADDAELYGGSVSFAASDMATIGASVYYFDLQSGLTKRGTQSAPFSYFTTAQDVTALYYGLNGSFAVSDALSLNAFGFIADYKTDEFGDGDTYVLNADARYKFDMGSVKARVLYVPDASGNNDAPLFDVAEAGLNGENLMFLGGDVYATNNGVGEDKYLNSLHNGDGLTALMLSANFNMQNDIYAKFALAYADTDAGDLGTEVGAMVGKKFFSNVDVSVRAATWVGGDSGYADLDENKVIGMVNVGF